MAEFESTTYAAQVLAASQAGSYISDSVLITGRPRFMQMNHIVTPAGANNDTYLMGYLPAGGVILPGSTIHVPANSGAGTLDLGIAGSTAEIAAGLDVSAAGIFLLPIVGGSYTSLTRQALVMEANGVITDTSQIYLNLLIGYGE